MIGLPEQLKTVFQRTLAMYQPGVPTSQLTPGTHLNAWDWGPGIALYGLHRAYRLVDEDAQQAYVRFWANWIEANLDRNAPSKAINGAILINVLWQVANDNQMPIAERERELWQGYCRERVAFYLREADRLSSGVFAHTVATGSPTSNQQVWADNLFMLVLLIAQIAADKENAGLFGQMINQLELHYRHLSDPASGLLYHGWQAEGEGGTNLNRAIWGRGNGWAAMGVVDLLELAQGGGPGFQAYPARILEAARPHFEGLLKSQREDGRWNTLLDQGWSYPETSATAGIGYAFLKGTRLGLLSPEYRDAGRRALTALSSQISLAGEIQGVSGSTPLLDSLEAYNQVPADLISTWGQGIGLLALSEGLVE